MNEKVNAVANALIRAGLKKGDRVAMWMFNSDWFVFAFYGIVKAGCVAVPVNFRLAPPEAEYIFDNSDAAIIICDDVFEPAVQNMRARLGKVRGYVSAGEGLFDGFTPLAEVLSSGAADEPDVRVDEFDESEILYTSGTTGRPKGALFQHHNHIVLVTTICALVGMRPTDVLLHAAPLFHSAELNLYMNPGTYLGSTQVVIKDFIPQKILALIEKERVSQFFGTPVMYTFLMNVPDFDSYNLSLVRYYGYGAAPMAAESVRHMIQRFKTDRFFCLCGFTEAGPGGIALQPEFQISKAGAGGRYIPNMECRLVDHEGRPIAAPGVVGELVIKGETAMKEYYKNPEATKETIRNGWVHSGDLGVMDADGFITLVDRKKDMVITGGENVYSKEVEDAIYEHPSVASAVIIGMPHRDWGETVMAVVTLKKDAALTLKELREFLKPRIADYKIPRLLEIVAQLPMNVSGKVLKYELREMFKDRSLA